MTQSVLVRQSFFFFFSQKKKKKPEQPDLKCRASQVLFNLALSLHTFLPSFRRNPRPFDRSISIA